MTLRRRLFATIVTAVLVSTVLTVVVSEVLVRHRAQVQALHTLTSNAAVLAASPLRTAGAGSHAAASRRALRRASALGTVFALQPGGSLVDLHPLPLPRARVVLAAIPPTSSASGKITVDGAALLYAAQTGRLGRIVLVRSARLGKGDAPPFATPIVLVGLLGVLLSALLAWLLARRVTRPLNEIAALSALLPHTHEPPAIERPTHAPSEIVALVDAFNQMAVELVSARGAQRDFLLAASHELRSPISAILAHAEAIEDDAVAPLESAPVIVSEAHRLERLVRDLLDLARLDRREFEVLRERVELHDVVATLIDRHAPRARELSVKLLASGQDARHSVWADRERLLQAASNLIENALRAAPPGSAIELSVDAGSLAISDRGPGLDEVERLRAFERFYLHRRHGERSHGGAGLGLAIVAELMRAMGGEAVVLPRDGGGARFELHLAAAPGAEQPQPVGSQRPGG